MGPFSASTGGGGHGQPSIFAPVTMEQAVDEMRQDGFKVSRTDNTAIVSKRWNAYSLTAVNGGVEGRRVTSTWTVATWAILILGPLIWIWLA
jgi:hypothetical protein